MAKPKILQQLNAEASSQILLKENPDVAMEAATKQYVDNNGGVFWAEYGVTTYAEVINALNNGKAIFSLYPASEYHGSNGTKILSLYTDSTIPTTELYFMPSTVPFTNQIAPPIYFTTLDSSNTWRAPNTFQNYFTQSIFNSTGITPITSSVRYYRPILTSTNPPSSTDGKVGDIWVVYSNE